MISRVFRVTALVTTLFLLVQVSSYDTDAEDDFENDMEADTIKHLSDDELIHQIHSMINAYRKEVNNGRYAAETNDLVVTKDKTWKRNADLINALLALPKGMTEAGR